MAALILAGKALLGGLALALGAVGLLALLAIGALAVIDRGVTRDHWAGGRWQ